MIKSDMERAVNYLCGHVKHPFVLIFGIGNDEEIEGVKVYAFTPGNEDTFCMLEAAKDSIEYELKASTKSV